MERLCKNCRWWEEDPYEDVEGSPHGCTNILMGRRLPYGNEDRMAPDELTVEKLEGSYPAVCTKPEFGCIHWEAKA